jgi:hypothetical protein
MENTSTDNLAKILWDYNCLYNPVKKADFIFVMGSHDIRVAQRGSELFLKGFAPLIVFSGNVGKLTKDIWNKPEAEIFSEEAIRMGVPKDAIFIENKSTNTGENVQFVKELMRGKQVSKVILVQKPYMQRRAYATMKKHWPEPDVIVTAPEISFENYPNDIVSKEYLINILVGDTQRIIDYAEKGFQSEQEMPNEVKEALEELIKRGYTKHLI